MAKKPAVAQIQRCNWNLMLIREATTTIAVDPGRAPKIPEKNPGRSLAIHRDRITGRIPDKAVTEVATADLRQADTDLEAVMADLHQVDMTLEAVMADIHPADTAMEAAAIPANRVSRAK